MSANPHLPREEKGRVHYAWVVLLSGMAIAAISSGVRTSFGVFIDPLVEQYGWSRGEISFAYSLIFLVAVPLVIGTGRISDRVGARRIILVGAVFFIGGMLLTAAMTRLWQFYLYFGVLVGGLGSTIFNLNLQVIVTHWFHRRVGVATGLMWTAVGLGPIFMPPLFLWLLTATGWRQSFTIIGVGGGALMLLAVFFLRSRPQDIGVSAYGEANPNPVAVAAVAVAPAPVPLPFPSIRRTLTFWYLIAIHFMGCVGHSIPLAHMVSVATFAGVPALVAAGMLSAMGVSSAVSRFGMSVLTERLGGKKVLTIALLLQSTPILILLGAREPWQFYLFAVLFGFGYGGEMVGFPIINRQYYGANAPLYSVYSYQVAGAMLGMAVGGWLGGALFDWSGGYTWTILAAALFGSAGLLPVLGLPPHRGAGSSSPPSQSS